LFAAVALKSDEFRYSCFVFAFLTTRSDSPSGPMKFAADSMLGKLAKWLRILGYDTLYAQGWQDDEFLQLADEGRLLLSRNSRLRKRVPDEKLVFIEENDPAEQLQALIRTLHLSVDPGRFFTRCTLCNSRLQRVAGREVVGKVPDHVWSEQGSFSKCESCAKVYWPGSHMARSRKEIARLLGV
jgi:uncharacterized protein with PIN domain